MVNSLAVKTCFSVQLFGRALFMLILPLAPIAYLFEPFELVLIIYIFFVIVFLIVIAVPIYAWGFFQRCPKCKNRILVLPKGKRRLEFVESGGWWYKDFGELINIIRSNKLPCHHCGNVQEM